MAFRVGQKVTRINGFHHHGNAPENVKRKANLPEFGIVYTVRFVNVVWGETILLLEEVNNEHLLPMIGGGIEPGFIGRGFRPVVSTNTGMAILEQIRRDVSNKILRPIFEDEQV